MLTPPWIQKIRSQAIRRIPRSYRFAKIEWLGFQCLLKNIQTTQLKVVSTGDQTSVQISPMDLMGPILEKRPKGLMIFHNHPSGSLVPSSEDFHLTKKVELLSKELGILYFGHAIVTRNKSRWI